MIDNLSKPMNRFRTIMIMFMIQQLAHHALPLQKKKLVEKKDKLEPKNVQVLKEKRSSSLDEVEAMKTKNKQQSAEVEVLQKKVEILERNCQQNPGLTEWDLWRRNDEPTPQYDDKEAEAATSYSSDEGVG